MICACTKEATLRSVAGFYYGLRFFTALSLPGSDSSLQWKSPFPLLLSAFVGFRKLLPVIQHIVRLTVMSIAMQIVGPKDRRSGQSDNAERSGQSDNAERSGQSDNATVSA